MGKKNAAAPPVVPPQVQPRAARRRSRRNSDLPSTVLALSCARASCIAQPTQHSAVCLPRHAASVDILSTAQPSSCHSEADTRMSQDSRGSRTRTVRHGLQLASEAHAARRKHTRGGKGESCSSPIRAEDWCHTGWFCQ